MKRFMEESHQQKQHQRLLHELHNAMVFVSNPCYQNLVEGFYPGLLATYQQEVKFRSLFWNDSLLKPKQEVAFSPLKIKRRPVPQHDSSNHERLEHWVRARSITSEVFWLLDPGCINSLAPSKAPRSQQSEGRARCCGDC